MESGPASRCCNAHRISAAGGRTANAGHSSLGIHPLCSNRCLGGERPIIPSQPFTIAHQLTVGRPNLLGLYGLAFPRDISRLEETSSFTTVAGQAFNTVGCFRHSHGCSCCPCYSPWTSPALGRPYDARISLGYSAEDELSRQVGDTLRAFCVAVSHSDLVGKQSR